MASSSSDTPVQPNPGMLDAVNKLEDMFKSTDNDIGNLERKLEAEYTNMFDEDNPLKDDLRNPVKVMKRITEVKTDFAQIRQDVVELQKLQLDALNQVKNEFEVLLTSLSSLDNKVLQSEAGDESVVQNEQKLLSLIEHMTEKTSSHVSQSATSHPAAKSSSASSSGSTS